MLPCPRPPDKDSLIKYAKEIKPANNLPLGIDKEHTPNKEWLLALLSTHKSDLHIFRKDYVAPARVPKLAAKPSINLPSDFLTGLPNSRKRTKAKRLTMIAKGKMESKIERIKTLQEKFKKESIKLDNQLKASKQKEMNRTQQSSHGWNPGSSTTPIQQQQHMQQTS